MIGELEKRLAAAISELETARADLQITRGERDAARRQLETTSSELGVVRSELETARGEIKTRDQVIRDRDAEISRFTLTLETSQRETDRLQRELAEAREMEQRAIAEPGSSTALARAQERIAKCEAEL